MDIDGIENEEYKKAGEEFQSKEIERGMDLLEKQGLEIIIRIIDKLNDKGGVKLTREELVTLKFFTILIGVQTETVRNDFKSQNGDAQFNEEVNQKTKSPQEIKEEKISIILKYFREFIKTNSMADIQRDYYNSMEVKSTARRDSDNEFGWGGWAKRNVSVESTISMNIMENLNSRLMIFKFDEPKLFLREVLNYIETNKNGELKYTFMPITPNVAIMFYVDSPLTKGSDNSKKITIFENDIAAYKHETIYKNIKIIKKKSKEYIKNKKPKTKEETNYHKKFFFLYETEKYHDPQDVFVFDVLRESAKTADLCNALALSRSKNQLIVYQNNTDLWEAESQMK